MRKYFFVILLFLIIFCIGCKQTGINKKHYFTVDFPIYSCKQNINENILEIYDEDLKPYYYNSLGELLFDKQILKKNVIIDDIEELVVAWDEDDYHLFVYNFKGKLDNVLTFSSVIEYVKYVVYDGKAYYIVFTKNKKCHIYTILKGRHFTFKNRNGAENIVCVNAYEAPDFYFITKNGKIYKGSLYKRAQPKLLYDSKEYINKAENIYPLGKSDFLIYKNGKYKSISQSNFNFEVEFDENDNFDNTHVFISQRGKYVIIDRETVFEKKNKKLKENILSMYNTKDNSEIWTTGSLFKSTITLAVNNYGDSCIVEDNKLIKYSNDLVPRKSYVLDGNIMTGCQFGQNIAVVTDTRKVYVIDVNDI